MLAKSWLIIVFNVFLLKLNPYSILLNICSRDNSLQESKKEFRNKTDLNSE